ncbi:MAG: protein-L-isoaspartate(D-aspartate) O-methyltransferase [Gemmatimonadetes bacterium]|nr:protein-L-isoaspartate(D-aspartate) O-methyltransferase [Gemmatimonadota bacterium]
MVASPVTPQFTGARRRLLDELRAKGISDLAVLRALDLTPRHQFVPTGVRHRAYEDAALPIGNGQTISQPYVHAMYLQTLGLKGQEKVLEIGTGSGYQTVLLAHLCRHVYSIERIRPLLETARDAITECGVTNVSLLCGDGTLGWPEFAPFDAILVGAGAPTVPQPLVDQLAEGGRLIVPIGGRDEQRLVEITRTATGTQRRELSGVRFVPLLGRHGWENE